MNVYITKVNGMSYMSTRQYAQQMTADIAHSLGMREMGIYRYNTEGESAESRGVRFDGIIAGINAGDIVICQFPTGNGLPFDRALVGHIKAYHGRIVIFIHDLEAMMSDKNQSTLQETVRLYNEAIVLIVPSRKMKNFLLKQGVRSQMKFIVQEMWDYVTNMRLAQPQGLKRELHFVGNPDNMHFPDVWDYDMPLKLYSNQDCRGSQVQKMGWLPPDRLLLELSHGGFGLTWFGNECWHQYLSMNNSMKIGTYLAAGIPVIVPRGISSQSMIEENHLGIVADSLAEAVETVKKMEENEYREYVSSVAHFAPLLREGYFTKKCLVDTVQMSMQEIKHVDFDLDETYEMPPCVFEYVCLNESYENNLALSWVFKGDADGFLVYDADSKEQLGEVFDNLEHYFLLRNRSKETHVVIKAYVRTVKGKMIIASSEEVSVREKCSREPRVSLIMPAYNAEAYIARSIDTALAQSFGDMEVIVVNDGSTDQTEKVIAWYGEKYPQVKYVYKPNGGQASARNEGIRRAVGEYVGFMDNDDMLWPNMIEKLHGAAVKNDCDIAMTSIYILKEDKRDDAAVYSVAEDVPIPMDEFLEYYFKYAYPVVWNKLYRASLVKNHMFSEIVYEDEAWTPCVLSYAKNICYLNEHLYEFDRKIRPETAGDRLNRRPIEEKFEDHKDTVMSIVKKGNQEKKEWLKRLAIRVYVNVYEKLYSYPKYAELREEIERME